MTYQVVLTKRAEQDRDQAYNWYREHYSREFGIRWYNGLHEQLQLLANNPTRCPEARENDLFPFEVREVLYGKRRKNHRALFTIHKDLVVVLHIRHTAQQDLTEDDL